MPFSLRLRHRSIASIEIFVAVSPLLVQIRRSDSALSSGYHAEIICEVWGSVPPAKVSWWKNGVNLEQDFEHTSMGEFENCDSSRFSQFTALEYDLEDVGTSRSVSLFSDGNLTTSVVRFQPRAEDNGQSLVCRAENPRMSVLGVREDQWDLNVYCESLTEHCTICVFISQIYCP